MRFKTIALCSIGILFVVLSASFLERHRLKRLLVKAKNASPPVVAVASSPTGKRSVRPRPNFDRIVARVGGYECRMQRYAEKPEGVKPTKTAAWYVTRETSTGKLLKITDLVSEADLIEGFLSSPAVRAAAKGDGASSAKLRLVQTVAALDEALKSLVLQFKFSDSCDTEKLEKLDLENFALVDFDPSGARMAVHFGLQSPSLQCNGDFPRLRIHVKAPDSLIEALNQARTARSGFFPLDAKLRSCENCLSGEVSTGYFVGG